MSKRKKYLKELIAKGDVAAIKEAGIGVRGIDRAIYSSAAKQAKNKAAAAASGQDIYQNLLQDTSSMAGQADLTGGIGDIQSSAEKLAGLIPKASTNLKTKKRDVENLLKAASMREAELRAKKAAPGFSAARSLLG